MKKGTLPLVAAFLFLLSSCSKVAPTSPMTGQRGSVSFQLDRTDVPANVVSVTASLSRIGSDTLSATLSLTSDTSAAVTISAVPEGRWHLTVDAMNDSGTIVYSGQTDVDVVSGVTTEVSLVLEPVSQGTGNIRVIVKWGNSSGLLVDYSANPVFTPGQNPSHAVGVAEEKVIYDAGVYRMWYLATYNPYSTSIWYAVSNDGINWTNETSYPVLNTDDSTNWDYGYYIACGAVIKDGGIYKMYYNAIRSSYGESEGGLATSTDGIHWQKYPTPVLPPDSVHYHIGTISVVKVGNLYYLFYNSSPMHNYNAWTINVATSYDGINWSRFSGNPILTPTSTWEGEGVTYPTVIYDNNEFIMLYESSDRQSYGFAYSQDGMNWTKNPDNPVFSVSRTTQNLVQIDYPCLVKANGMYRVYYTSVDPGEHMAICFASASTVK